MAVFKKKKKTGLQLAVEFVPEPQQLAADKVRAPSLLKDANFLAIRYTYWVCLYDTKTSKFPIIEQFHSQKLSLWKP